MKFLKIIKRKSSGGFLTLGLLLLAVVIFNWAALAQTVKQAAFLYGKAQVIFSDSAQSVEKDTYLINLKNGQSCQIEVKWRGANIEHEGQKPAGYTIILPDGKIIVDPADGDLEAEIAGDYKVLVSPRTANTNHRYQIVFTQY